MNVIVPAWAVTAVAACAHAASARWHELVMRAVMVTALVNVTVTFSFRSPQGSGILAVFPVVLISIMLILHRRVGGPPTAAVIVMPFSGWLASPSPPRRCIFPPCRRVASA